MSKRKVLIVHNYYQKRGGEDVVVDQMVLLFRELGFEVDCFTRSSQELKTGILGFLNAFISPFYNIKTHLMLRKKIRTFDPDVVNIHNLFPLISPLLMYGINKRRKLLMTVHNYRLICPTGLFLRNGIACEMCLDNKSPISCGLNNCENSFFKSWAYALRNKFSDFAGSYRNNVDQYICLTAFQKQKLISAGFDKDKICVIPNFVNISHYRKEHGDSYIAYVGRLSYEKGWDQLCDIAIHNANIKVKFAGSAGSIELLEQLRFQYKPYENIEFLGQLDRDELTSFVNNASFLVIPSRCYEGFPLAALEAFSLGVPVIGPKHGGFSEIISEGDNAAGILYNPNDQGDLENQVKLLWRNYDLLDKYSLRAINKILTSYNKVMVKAMWLELINGHFYEQ